MIILDTDHVTVLRYPEHSDYPHLTIRMDRSDEGGFAMSAPSVEEQLRGWLAAIHRTRNVHDQILYYARLIGLIEFLSRWQIVAFDEGAADRFVALRKDGIRIGTMDLKIAAIALDQGALLLSANLRDFEQVPGLRVENWLR